jgi:hypothetical protein
MNATAKRCRYSFAMALALLLAGSCGDEQDTYLPDTYLLPSGAASAGGNALAALAQTCPGTLSSNQAGDVTLDLSTVVGPAGTQVTTSNSFATEVFARSGVGVNRTGYWYGAPLIIHETQYDSNLSMVPETESDAIVTFDLHALAANCGSIAFTTFSCLIGVESQSESIGVADQPKQSVIFRVLVDGRVAYESSVMNGLSAVQSIELDVSHATTLSLVTNNAGTPANCPIWADHGQFILPRLAASLPLVTPGHGDDEGPVDVVGDSAAGDDGQGNDGRPADDTNGWAAMPPCGPTYNANGSWVDLPVLVGSVGTQVMVPDRLTTEVFARSGVGVNRTGYWYGGPLIIHGTQYDSNLSMVPEINRDALVTFDLRAVAANCGMATLTTFTALIGVESQSQAAVAADQQRQSVIFRVLVDGRVAYESSVLNGLSAVQTIALDVSQAATLSLVTNNAGTPAGYALWGDHGQFMQPRLTGRINLVY